MGNSCSQQPPALKQSDGFRKHIEAESSKTVGILSILTSCEKYFSLVGKETLKAKFYFEQIFYSITDTSVSEQVKFLSLLLIYRQLQTGRSGIQLEKSQVKKLLTFTPQEMSAPQVCHYSSHIVNSWMVRRVNAQLELVEILDKGGFSDAKKFCQKLQRFFPRKTSYLKIYEFDETRLNDASFLIRKASRRFENF